MIYKKDHLNVIVHSHPTSVDPPHSQEESSLSRRRRLKSIPEDPQSIPRSHPQPMNQTIQVYTTGSRICFQFFFGWQVAVLLQKDFLLLKDFCPVRVWYLYYAAYISPYRRYKLYNCFTKGIEELVQLFFIFLFYK